jgi:hypothetical protein
MPESSLLIAPGQQQEGAAAAPRRGDTPEISKTSKASTHLHQEPGTGALPSSTTQPTTHHDDDSSSCHDGSCAPTGTASPGVLETLRSQMHAGFQRRNAQFVQEIFDKHASSDSPGLSKASLAQALSDLGVCLSAAEVDELFKTQDLKSDGCISLPEFLTVTSKPGKIEGWATTLPLAALLADCMPSKDEADPLRGISKLREADMQAISACYSEGLFQLLRCVTISMDALSLSLYIYIHIYMYICIYRVIDLNAIHIYVCMYVYIILKIPESLKKRVFLILKDICCG